MRKCPNIYPHKPAYIIFVSVLRGAHALDSYARPSTMLLRIDLKHPGFVCGTAPHCHTNTHIAHNTHRPYNWTIYVCKVHAYTAPKAPRVSAGWSAQRRHTVHAQHGAGKCVSARPAQIMAPGRVHTRAHIIILIVPKNGGAFLTAPASRNLISCTLIVFYNMYTMYNMCRIYICE